MQFTTFALTALSIGGALAQTVTVHVVKVGNANGTLAYAPNNLVAAVGDMVQFQFAPANHTVTQSTFDAPCQPIAMHSNVTGIFSGFMPVKATDTDTPTYTIMINSTTPMWLYCSQGKHCQNGMVMVINENTAANSTRSLTMFKQLASQATVNLPGNAVSNGTSGSTSSSGSSSGSSTTSAGSSKTTTSSATTVFKPTEVLSLGGLLALAIALFV